MKTPLAVLPLLVAVVAGALAASPVAADVHPNIAPGFPADQSFHVGDVDSVNLFNGGLTITLPIGPSYPVNGGFSYGLKLVYNSNPWLFETVHHDPLGGPSTTRTQAWPNPCSNAGLGWRLSFGRMNPPCQVRDSNGSLSPNPIYQDENGTDHIFYETLHARDSVDPPLADGTKVRYTRDGSYLRLKVHPSRDWDIEFPDGSDRHFRTDGLPTTIRDAFGNGLDLAYSATDWTLTDTKNRRTVTIHFITTLPSYPQGVIQYIELPIFGNTPPNSPANTYRYMFSYTTPTIGRACPNNDAFSGEMGLGTTVAVPLLGSVSLPDGSSWSMPGYVTAQPADKCTENGGEITALKLPTLGSLEWSWQKVYFPTGSTNRLHLQTNPGVATRTMFDAGHSALGTWTYIEAPGFPDAITSREHKTTVVDPLGHSTVNYFSTAVDLVNTGWSTYDYSLPFTRNQTINVAAGVDLNLSRQVFAVGGALLRSEYTLYERDPWDAVSPPDIYNTNRRPLRSRTVYNDDGGTYNGAVSSGFDGLGHYRTQTTEGNFPGSNVRTRFANFNPAQGTYSINAAANTGSGYSPFPAIASWVLEAPSFVSGAEGGATAQTDFCYAAGSAAVTRKRVHRLDGSATSAQDLVSVYDLVEGNVTAEKSYGGDSQAVLGGGSLCTLSLPATAKYEVDHTYTQGSRTASQYTGANFLSLNQTVDPATGLPSSTTDTAGLRTNYLYDTTGRLTWSQPPQGGWTEYAYFPATGSNPPNVVVRRRANGSPSATILAVDQLVFDSFGRLFQELKTLPDGNTSKRQTTYDGNGNKAKVSEWAVGAPSNFSWFLNYDPFGRPGVIQPADGNTHDVTLAYHGVRQVDRTVKVATAAGGETSATTTEVSDAHGRLFSVTEPSGSSGASVTTFYGYDVGNRLASVSTTAAGITQNRSFTYDRAGLLQSETHPEKGVSGNGSVTYPKYDARGHALQKVDGPHNLTFQYDSAERLGQILETGPNGRPLKAFSYSPGNGTNDWSLGKLQKASRFNYVTLGSTVFSAQIDETYTYGGRDGRVSKRNTQSSTGEAFTQSFTYNDLGLVSQLNYPLCTHAGCTTPAPAVFTDVPISNPAQHEIEAIYAAGVTTGCSATPPGTLQFCPGNTMTRAEMAAFLIRAASGASFTPPAPNCSTPIFADVPCTQWAAAWIEELYRRGITTGCASGPLRYCPDNPVMNSEMAAFLLRAKEGTSYTPPACTGAGPFLDVACTFWDAAQIAELKRRGIMLGCGGGNFCAGNSVLRQEMAVYLARTFDLPVLIDTNTPRNVNFAYAQGMLTGVTSGATTYGTLAYYPNLLVSQVAHGNGVVETQGNDPNGIRRPSSLAATGPYASWSSGTYSYDGAGNIKAIGPSAFTYDPVSRLVSASVNDGPTGTGTQKQQSYTFDAFGNLQAIAGTSGRSTPTSSQTNHLSGGSVSYDGAGNLTAWNGATYAYDAFNQMVQMTSGAENWAYLYTADDERVWSYDVARNASHWTLRDLGGKVLRDYQSSQGHWSVGTDYLYREGLLLAAETQTGQRHFHLDHLGTPRLITRASGDRVAYHVYYPFGEELTAFNQDTERMKFTGHERDLASPAGPGDDLDYMHARHESPVTGRFLSVDIGKPREVIPQSWNRYVYALDNPLRYLDPNGQDSEEPSLYQAIQKFISNGLAKLFPPSQERIDPNSQALAEDGEISQSQAMRLTPSSEMSLAQKGLIDAGSSLSAGVIFAGLKAGEVSLFGEIVSGYSVGGTAELEGGSLRLNVSLLGKLPEGGGTLRGLLSSFEREAARLGADNLVVEGRLAKDMFSSAKAQEALAKLGYTFRKLGNGSFVLTKALTR